VSHSYQPSGETALAWLCIIAQHQRLVEALHRRGVNDYPAHFTLIVGHLTDVFEGVEHDEVFERAQLAHIYGGTIDPQISDFIYQALALAIFADVRSRGIEVYDFRVFDEFINNLARRHGMTPPPSTFTVRAQSALETLHEMPITGPVGIKLVDMWLCSPDAEMALRQDRGSARFNAAAILSVVLQYANTEALGSTLNTLTTMLR